MSSRDRPLDFASRVHKIDAMVPNRRARRLAFAFAVSLAWVAMGSACLRVPMKAAGATSKAAMRGLKLFIQATAEGDDRRAYAMVSKSAKHRSDATISDLPVSEVLFVKEAGFEEIDTTSEVYQAALRSRPGAVVDRRGVLTTAHSAVYSSSAFPTVARRRLKMDHYTVGEPVVLNARRVEIPITFRGPGGGTDRDRAVMVLENGRWLVANPIHLIR